MLMFKKLGSFGHSPKLQASNKFPDDNEIRATYIVVY